MPEGEIIFQVRESPEGGREAGAVEYSIFTEGDDWEAPQAIRVHTVQN